MSKKVINQNTNYDSELLNSIDTNYIFNEKPINRLKITSDNLNKDNIDKKKEVPVILKAGQMALHHCLLAHGSGVNHTNNYRIGIAIRYLSTHVKQTEGPPISMILVRGKDNYNHFMNIFSVLILVNIF